MTPGLIAFQNRLSKVWRHFGKIARRQGVTCFRFYDHDLPEAPIAIEFLAGAAHIAEYKRNHGMDEEEHAEWMGLVINIVSEVCGIKREAIFTKRRQRKAGRFAQYEKQSDAKVERIVKEGGLSFILNMTDYLDTGLFLDHRTTRDIVRRESTDRDILNLFCYTGSFSVYAASAGARSVTSVDLSNTYIHWALRNLQYNKLYRPEQHHFVAADVLDWVNHQDSEKYDLIICDPPTFSNSKRMEGDWEVQRDHAALLNRLLLLLRPGGTIYFSNNFRDFRLDTDLINACAINDITGATTPFDFAGRLQRACYKLQK